MKKKLLAILAFVCCIQVAFAADRNLSFTDLKAYENLGKVDSATGVITFLDNWGSVAGWEFATPISKEEYKSVKITFSEAVVSVYLNVRIKYVGVNDPSIFYISAGLTTLLIDFTGDVESISFFGNFWEGVPTEAPSITLDKVLLIESTHIEEEPLSLSDLVAEWWGGTADASTGIITFNYNWERLMWNFDSPKTTDIYVGVQIDFAEPIAYSDVAVRVKYVGETEDAGHFGIANGSSSITISFVKEVESIALRYGGEVWPEPAPTITISKAYLIKKAIPTVTIPEAGITTFSSVYPTLFDDSSIEIYTVNSTENATAKLSPFTGIIPANEGVIIKGTPGDYIGATRTVTLDPLVGNLLVGCPAETIVPTAADTKYYVLSLDAENTVGSAGFYYYEAEGAGGFTVPAGKTYLPITTTQAGGAPAHIALSFGDDSPTGLGTETQTATTPVDVYSIDGCLIRSNVLPAEALQGLDKGLYIVGGKKVVLY